MSEWNRLPKEGGWCEKTLLKKVSCLDGDVEIPNIYINNSTLFCNNTSALLSEVEIPASFDGSAVKKISDNMFRGDTHIVSVVIPEGVKEIGASCFRECSNLVSVSLPSTITTIGSEAFQYCEKLESVKIPSGVTKIEPDTFSRCYSLSEVVIPNTVTTIGYGAFHSCPMKSIEIPDSVTSIGWVAFYDSKLTSLVIPDSVRYIDSEAFANSSLLESAVISGNLSSIPNKLFENCTNLSLIMFNGTVAKWNSLNKGSGWNEGVPATKVVCLDGEVNL